MRINFLAGIILVFVIFVIAALSSEKEVKHVLLIGWDGAQQAHIKECLLHNRLPHLAALAKDGTMVSIVVEGQTDTESGFARILTGYGSSTNHILSDDTKTTIPPGYTVFERLENYFGSRGIVTGAIISKKHRLGYSTTEDAYYYTAKVMDVFEHGLLDDVRTAGHAMVFLERYQRERSFLFVAFAAADVQGHQYGENSEEYDTALVEYDVLTGRLVQKLKDLGIYENTIIYVTADHGFDEGAKEHIFAKQVFLVSNDSNQLMPGVQTDIAPTILKKFGINVGRLIPPFDGKPLNL